MTDGGDVCASEISVVYSSSTDDGENFITTSGVSELDLNSSGFSKLSCTSSVYVVSDANSSASKINAVISKASNASEANLNASVGAVNSNLSEGCIEKLSSPNGIDDTEVEDQIFPCKVCGKKFKKAKTAKKHCKNGPWVCPKCGDRIKHSTNVRRHKERCSKPQKIKLSLFKCDVCQTVFQKKHILKRHKKKVHGTDSVGSINCPEIGCQFSSDFQAQIKKHITLKHYREYEYKCATCSYKCFSEGRLMKHFKDVHTENTKFCRSCDLYFLNKADMKTHMDTMHSDGDI